MVHSDLVLSEFFERINPDECLQSALCPSRAGRSMDSSTAFVKIRLSALFAEEKFAENFFRDSIKIKANKTFAYCMCGKRRP